MKTSTLLKASLVAGFAPPPPALRTGWNNKLLRNCSALFSLCALLIGHLAVGQTTFYISPDGDDGNAGAVETAPWRTIDKVNIELLTGGNKTFLFERGEEHRGAIHAPFGVNNINFGSYGTGNAPVIKNSLEVADGTWSVPDGNIYKASVAIPPNAKMVRLYYSGDLLTYARYPTSGWLRTDNVYNDPWRFTDAELTEDATNAEVVIRVSNWEYKRLPVSDHSGAVISVDGELAGVAVTQPGASSAEWGYFLCGKYDFLDADGEWYYDEGEGDLYYYSTSGPPTNIEYALQYVDGSLGAGIAFNSTVEGLVEDLEFRHQTDAAISLSTASNITIQNCSFQDLSSGVAGDGGVGLHQIKECAFTRIYDNGIRLSSSGCRIDDNTFDDIALLPGERPNTFGGYGILADGDNATVTRNRLNNIGYSGIGNQGNGGLIKNNSISNWLYTLNDGAAITFDNCTDLEVRNNIVHAPFFSIDPDAELSDRLESVSLVYTERTDITFGIYFGNRPAIGVVLENNVVYGCAAGIHVDHTTTSADNIIRNNTLFNNDVQLNLLDHSNCMILPGDDPCLSVAVGPGIPYQGQYNTEYEGNVLYCLNSAQVCMQQGHSYAGSHTTLVDYGTFNNNYYFNPFTDIAVLQRMFYPVTGVTQYLGGSVIPHTLAGWQNPPAMALRDLGSTRSPLRLKDFDAFGLTAIPNDALSTNMSGGNLSGWNAGTYTSPVCNDCQQGGHALRAVDQNWIERNGAVMWTDGPGTQGTPVIDPGQYHFTFRMRSPDTDAIRFGPVYQDPSYRQYQYLGLSPEWRTYEVAFNVPDLGGNDYMVSAFQNVQYSLGMLGNSVVELDFIEAKACTLNTGHSATIEEEHILRYNCPLTTADDQNVGSSFTMPGDPDQCWSDVYGNFYAGGSTYELEPWQSVVLFRRDATFDIDQAQFTVSTNTTWNTNKNIRGSVVVEDGNTLTIDGATIRFAESNSTVTTNIVVEPGGMLVLKNDAHLTTLEECGPIQLWDGIKVLGVTAGRDWSPEQGRVEMMSGARISNAFTGILAGDADPTSPGFTGSEPGGAIRTQNAFFENNLYDVVMHSGGTLKPLISCNGGPCEASAFQNTQFRTTAPLNRTELDPKTHLRLSNRGTTWVYGCTFSNDLTEHTESLRMGHGLEGFNTAVRVVHCILPSCGTPAPNTFSNLDHGIRLTEAIPKTPVAIVHGNEFADNICGVYANGVRGVSIVDNDFTMGKWSDVELTGDDDVMFALHHRAIFTTASNSLEIKDNSMVRTAGNSTLLEGIIVGYTRDANEVVFRNGASDLDLAFVGEGISADVDGDPAIVGLQFQCNSNTNTNNETNFLSRTANGDAANEFRHTIRERQGTPTYSASNTFGGALHFAVETRTDAIEFISYSYTSGQAPATYTVQNVLDLDQDYLVPTLVTTSLNCPNDPPVWLVGGTTRSSAKAALSVTKVEHADLNYLYKQLIDGGNTPQVVQEIVGFAPHNIIVLRDRLLSGSPYLSTAALVEVMSKEELTDVMRAEILITNPDATKKEGFLRWAEQEAPYPLPGYLAAAVEASWSTRTYRTTLEESLADAHTRLSQLANHALYTMQTDSLPATPDSLRWVLQQVRTSSARYTEAAWLMAEKRFVEADSLVEAMPAEKSMKGNAEQERQRMLTLIELISNASDQSRDEYALNNTEVDVLLDLVGEHYDRPAIWASNLLCAGYGKCRTPYTGGSLTPKRLSGRVRNAALPVNSAPTFGVQPNPARMQATFNYHLPEGSVENGSIVVRDLVGRTMVTLPMVGVQGQQVWELHDAAPGTYLVQYLSGEKLLGADKLIIQR